MALSMVLFVYIILTLFLFQETSASNHDKDTSESNGGIPAGVVLLLLFFFTSLALLCVREVRKDYLAQRAYEASKATQSIAEDRFISKLSYGTNRPSPPIKPTDASNHDITALDHNTIIDRLSQYRDQMSTAITTYLETTPDPVCFEVPSMNVVEAFCENPSASLPKHILDKRKSVLHTHSAGYDPENVNPELLQILKRTNRNKNNKINNKRSDEQINNDIESVDEDIERSASATHSPTKDEYDVIPESNDHDIHVYDDDDSDQNLSDTNIGTSTSQW